MWGPLFCGSCGSALLITRRTPCNACSTRARSLPYGPGPLEPERPVLCSIGPPSIALASSSEASLASSRSALSSTRRVVGRSPARAAESACHRSRRARQRQNGVVPSYAGPPHSQMCMSFARPIRRVPGRQRPRRMVAVRPFRLLDRQLAPIRAQSPPQVRPLYRRFDPTGLEATEAGPRLGYPRRTVRLPAPRS